MDEPSPHATRLGPIEARTSSAEETAAFARDLGSRLARGAILLLHGDLGAGKTVFVRGLAAGLGANPEDVSSPTFTLVQEYQGRLRLQHVDLYRVVAGHEVEELGLDEYAALGDVVAIEWAERLSRAPAGALRVTITDLGEDERLITVADARTADR